MGTPGRNTKRTPEVEKAILDAIRVGATQKDAAAAAGIDETTLGRWKNDFADFAYSLTRAEGECAAKMSARLHLEATKADGDWRASVEWLKRRRRDDWGDNVSVRADERVAQILAEMFPADEGAGTSSS